MTRRLVHMLTLWRGMLVGFVLVVSTSVSLGAQQTTAGTASISGRVTVAGKPARGVAVTLRGSGSSNDRRSLQLQMLFEQGSFEKATTDEDGRYRFESVAAGRYSIIPYAPSLILDDNQSVTITVGDGERVDDRDFSLSKGGVISGRVTGHDGRPMIMEPVQVATVNKANSNAASDFGGPSFTTDDRGIYRVYGLAPGHYKVIIGKADARLELAGLSYKRPDHAPTFHPGVTDETRAAIVEVTGGAETPNIDIKVGVAEKTYNATGRVIEAATGKPLSNAITSYRLISGHSSSIAGMTGLGSPSSSTGEFRFEGLNTGRYTAFALFGVEGSSEYYTEMLNFEIKQEDVSGLEIKVHRGGSISGVAVVEGANDPGILERMGRTEIFALVMGEDPAPNFARSKIAEDGSFQLRGLKTGKVSILLQDFFSQSGLSILRVERGGVPQPAGIDLAAGEHIADVRLVMAHANGVIRGQVNIEGGTLPKEAEISVVASRVSDGSNPIATGDDSQEADVDASRRFVVEGLVPGEYEVQVTVVLNPSAPAKVRQVKLGRERVTVSSGSTSETVIVLDLSKRSEKN
jgi:hypothetical protein